MRRMGAPPRLYNASSSTPLPYIGWLFPSSREPNEMATRVSGLERDSRSTGARKFTPTRESKPRACAAFEEKLEHEERFNPPAHAGE